MGGTGMSPARPEGSGAFPWYDSGWLSRYLGAEATLKRFRPDVLPSFVEAFRVLHTRPDFAVRRLRPFDEATLADIRSTVASLRPPDLELHEARRFGRFVVHDHPWFTALQERTVPLMSELVGEPVEPSYNFLSLYTERGVCAVHMDAPEAKWTLDLCVDQSAPWPIHFSQVLPWPNLAGEGWGDDWEESIKRSPAHRFESHALEPGEAVAFSGSSQWHYREPMPAAAGRSFCTLLFFHYVPAGTRRLIQPEEWARIFGVAELDR